MPLTRQFVLSTSSPEVGNSEIPLNPPQKITGVVESQTTFDPPRVAAVSSSIRISRPLNLKTEIGVGNDGP